jgi:hypothetical protein
VFCHRLPFGTDGLSTIEGETQEIKVARLRNLYQKVGKFGVAGGATPARTTTWTSSRPSRRNRRRHPAQPP